MHMNLPWVEGPRAPRPVLPKVWAPKAGTALEAVLLAPVRRLAVHWNGVKHQLHFPEFCPGCATMNGWAEHGYVAALVRLGTHGGADVECWEHGVLQLTERPLTQVAFRTTEPWLYILRRNGGGRTMISVDKRPCPRAVWLQGRPFEISPTLERLYGLRWKDATGKIVGAAVDPREKGGRS